ncbi:RNA polymerase subunit sigma-24 [Cellulomonas sp. A375-1]|nr:MULTISPECIES: sigma-70 family RNA polymerase sigma factor [Cellulomonas]KMM46675.1 RNA polymerase subunit sigma-24 [Cellulomonas sp. A375-1]MCR6705130.1 sigma-70 family RNA polymerase sigma factor [Cellulomonas sp.]
MSSRWEPMLDQLVRERYPRLLSRATLLCGSRHDAEDLVQDALVATFGGRARFDSIGEAEHYVRRAIATRFIDRGRRTTRERDAHRRLAGHAQPVVEIQLPGLTRELVDALAQLPPRTRACVVLRHLEDLSVRETADTLNLSEGAVKRYTADAVALLNAALGTTAPAETIPVQTTEVRRGA